MNDCYFAITMMPLSYAALFYYIIRIGLTDHQSTLYPGREKA